MNVALNPNAITPPTTRDEWQALGKRLFGDDQSKWVFRCPTCKNELSIAKVREIYAAELPKLRERGYAIEQECIGRHIAGVGCNWAAYGLFRGPWIVDGVPVFEFGGRST